MHTLFWWVNLQKRYNVEDLSVNWQYLTLKQTCNMNGADRADLARCREDSPASVTTTVNFQSYAKRGNSCG